MFRVNARSITFVGNLRELLAALTDALRRNLPGMTVLEYCRERTGGRPG